MLAQEQGIIMRDVGAKKELEGELGLGGELEGTLILTNQRLIFVNTNEETLRLLRVRLRYSDVKDLESIPIGQGNMFVDVRSISVVKGHRGELRPSLEIRWSESGEERGKTFSELVTGRSRRRNLNDWAPVIERLMNGSQKLVELVGTPGVEILEGKIMRILSDMQWRGVFGIEEAVEKEFKIDLDSDDVQSGCERLASQRLLKKRPEPGGEAFYRKCSPLGEDDLSD